MPVVVHAKATWPPPRGGGKICPFCTGDHNHSARTSHGHTAACHMPITKKCKMIELEGNIFGRRHAWGGAVTVGLLAGAGGHVIEHRLVRTG